MTKTMGKKIAPKKGVGYKPLRLVARCVQLKENVCPLLDKLSIDLDYEENMNSQQTVYELPAISVNILYIVKENPFVKGVFGIS